MPFLARLIHGQLIHFIFVFRLQTSPNIDTQRSAVRCLPGFLAVINRASYCLLTEEIGPLVRSSRECVREELAKICGDVACVLANNCQVVFTTDEVDSRQGNSGSAMEYGYKVECNTCEEGTNVLRILYFEDFVTVLNWSNFFTHLLLNCYSNRLGFREFQT